MAEGTGLWVFENGPSLNKTALCATCLKVYVWTGASGIFCSHACAPNRDASIKGFFWKEPDDKQDYNRGFYRGLDLENTLCLCPRCGTQYYWKDGNAVRLPLCFACGNRGVHAEPKHPEGWGPEPGVVTKQAPVGLYRPAPDTTSHSQRMLLQHEGSPAAVVSYYGKENRWTIYPRVSRSSLHSGQSRSEIRGRPTFDSREEAQLALEAYMVSAGRPFDRAADEKPVGQWIGGGSPYLLQPGSSIYSCAVIRNLGPQLFIDGRWATFEDGVHGTGDDAKLWCEAALRERGIEFALAEKEEEKMEEEEEVEEKKPTGLYRIATANFSKRSCVLVARDKGVGLIVYKDDEFAVWDDLKPRGSGEDNAYNHDTKWETLNEAKSRLEARLEGKGIEFDHTDPDTIYGQYRPARGWGGGVVLLANGKSTAMIVSHSEQGDYFVYPTWCGEEDGDDNGDDCLSDHHRLLRDAKLALEAHLLKEGRHFDIVQQQQTKEEAMATITPTDQKKSRKYDADQHGNELTATGLAKEGAMQALDFGLAVGGQALITEALKDIAQEMGLEEDALKNIEEHLGPILSEFAKAGIDIGAPFLLFTLVTSEWGTKLTPKAHQIANLSAMAYRAQFMKHSINHGQQLAGLWPKISGRLKLLFQALVSKYESEQAQLGQVFAIDPVSVKETEGVHNDS